MAWQTRETVDFDKVACGPSASARAASTSRTDRPRTNPAMTRVSNAFVFVTPAPNSRETNLASSSARIRSVGDTRTDTGVVLPVQTWSSCTDPTPVVIYTG